jgi:hypothetical protein
VWHQNGPDRIDHHVHLVGVLRRQGQQRGLHAVGGSVPAKAIDEPLEFKQQPAAQRERAALGRERA